MPTFWRCEPGKEVEIMNETRLCFRRIDRLAQSYVARNTRGSGLTPAQIQALRHITWHGTMSQQELVEDMGIDKAAVTRLAAALEEKGYNPINQIVGYIMSGDPTYITSHNNARSLIMKVERDEIIEELMRNYVETCIERKGREKK